MEDKDFNEAVEEIVNVFMRIATNHSPEDLFNLATAVFMNIMAIIPYPIMRAAQEGNDFSPKYKELVMEMMPKFTLDLRGHVAEFLHDLINKSIGLNLVKEGEFEFLGHAYPDMSEPPKKTVN